MTAEGGLPLSGYSPIFGGSNYSSLGLGYVRYKFLDRTSLGELIVVTLETYPPCCTLGQRLGENPQI
uniref:Uncharacterized protein n=1 Tax=Magallana gigas TaxID=29159 RepID=K1PC37_MAGGI